MVRDARYHYIRNFMPDRGWDAILYSWSKAPYMLEEWRKEAEAGRLKAGTRQACFFSRSKPPEELYDMEADPYQMHNLAGDPKHEDVLKRMREEGERWIVENRDLGLLSMYELYARSQGATPYEMGRDPKRNPVARLLEAANLANRRDPASIPPLLELLKNPDGAVRRWGAIGLLALGEKAAPAAEALAAALKDPAPDVRLAAAEALCRLGRPQEGVAALIEALSHDSSIIRYEALYTLSRLGDQARPALPHLDKAETPTKDGWRTELVSEAVDVVRAMHGRPVRHRPSAKQGPVDFKASRMKYCP